VNDYSEAKSELLKKDKEIVRLRTQLTRARENDGKIKHLRSVIKNPE
jgi:predicted dithiol-disulfide oxidoreductase (DUF899 family)